MSRGEVPMARREVLWTNTALDDLWAIVEHIAATDPAAAQAVLDRLQARAATLAALTARGRVVAELRAIGVNQYRELIERPWRIVYRVEAGRVLVVAALDSRRELHALLLERLVRA